MVVPDGGITIDGRGCAGWWWMGQIQLMPFLLVPICCTYGFNGEDQAIPRDISSQNFTAYQKKNMVSVKTQETRSH